MNLLLTSACLWRHTFTVVCGIRDVVPVAHAVRVVTGKALPAQRGGAYTRMARPQLIRLAGGTLWHSHYMTIHVSTGACATARRTGVSCLVPC
jgi:hypothetical protein